MADSERILVVGGGIGGLSLAAGLERAGLPYLVLEREPVLHPIGSAIALYHNTMRGLDALGIADVLRPDAAPLRRLENCTSDGAVEDVIDLAPISSELGFEALVTLRADLQDALLQRVDSARLVNDARCVEFRQDRDGVVALLHDGREKRGAALIGADGLRSVARRQLHGDEPLRYVGYVYLRGLTELDSEWELEWGTWKQYVGPAVRLAVAHASHGLVWWVATFNAPEGAHAGPAGAHEALLQRLEGYAPLGRAIVEATREDGILRGDIYDRPPIARWGEGRVTLLGDAAHPMTPNLGQGAGMAIEDAVVLANRLAERGTSGVTAALRDYEAARVGRTANVAFESWIVGQVSQGLLDPRDDRSLALGLSDREYNLRYVAS